jgi:hypothetical protein
VNGYGGTILASAETLDVIQITTINSGDHEIALGRRSLLDWYITMFMPITPAMFLASPLSGVFFLSIFIILLIFIIINIFIRTILKPLEEMVTILKEIAAE